MYLVMLCIVINGTDVGYEVASTFFSGLDLRTRYRMERNLASSFFFYISFLLCSRSLRFISGIIECPLCHLRKNIRSVCKLDQPKTQGIAHF